MRQEFLLYWKVKSFLVFNCYDLVSVSDSISILERK